MKIEFYKFFIIIFIINNIEKFQVSFFIKKKINGFFFTFIIF